MDIASAHFTIGTLSKPTGCNVETIRYYERVGLLPLPVRTPGGYRLYGIEHLKRLTFIRRARALGFSIEEVRRLLNLADHHKRPCREARKVAAAHLEDIRSKIADLKAMERVLKETVARCADGKGSHCPLIETLYRQGPAAGAELPQKVFLASARLATCRRIKNPPKG
jgi:MerR family mercuric resistance operon transcriptional regulator